VSEGRPTAAGPLPTFIIIGAQKSATRWLRNNLGEHPDVYIADRELAFFSNRKRFEDLGLDWYRTQFTDVQGETIIGEGTPAYMMWRHHPEQVAQRIDESLPDARVLAILRNPVDRAMSAMVHHVQRERLPVDANLLDVVRETPPEEDFLALVAGGWYAASLAPYAERFGDRLMVLIHDDISTEPRTVFENAAAHVGASSDFVPTGLERVVYSNKARSPEVRTRLTYEERRQLWQYFQDDVRDLEVMIGRDLSIWDPERSTPVPSATASPQPPLP
jgi:hypothetical protein